MNATQIAAAEVERIARLMHLVYLKTPGGRGWKKIYELRYGKGTAQWAALSRPRKNEYRAVARAVLLELEG